MASCPLGQGLPWVSCYFPQNFRSSEIAGPLDFVHVFSLCSVGETQGGVCLSRERESNLEPESDSVPNGK